MGLRIRTGGQILDLSGDEYNPGTLGTKRLKIRTGGQIKEYGLTTDPSAKSYCGLNFNLNGSKFYIGRKTSASGSTLTTTEISSTREGNATRVSDYRDGYWNYTYTYNTYETLTTGTNYSYNSTVNTYRSRSSYATASSGTKISGTYAIQNVTSWWNHQQQAKHTPSQFSVSNGSTNYYHLTNDQGFYSGYGTFYNTNAGYSYATASISASYTGQAGTGTKTTRYTQSRTTTRQTVRYIEYQYVWANTVSQTVTGLNSYRGVATQSGQQANGTVSGVSPLSGGGRTVSYAAGGNWNAGAYSGTYNPSGVLSYQTNYALIGTSPRTSVNQVTSRSNSPVSSSYYTYWATRQSNYTYESNYTYTTDTTMQSSMSTHNFV